MNDLEHFNFSEGPSHIGCSNVTLYFSFHILFPQYFFGNLLCAFRKLSFMSASLDFCLPVYNARCGHQSHERHVLCAL